MIEPRIVPATPMTKASLITSEAIWPREPPMAPRALLVAVPGYLALGGDAGEVAVVPLATTKARWAISL